MATDGRIPKKQALGASTASPNRQGIFMEKIDRARIILGQTLSMDRSGGITESGANGDNFSNLIFRRVEVKSRWERNDYAKDQFP